MQAIGTEIFLQLRRLSKKTLGMRAVATKNERAQLEMKIMKYRLMARHMAADPVESERIRALVAELERKLREIDGWWPSLKAKWPMSASTVCRAAAGPICAARRSMMTARPLI